MIAKCKTPRSIPHYCVDGCSLLDHVRGWSPFFMRVHMQNSEGGDVSKLGTLKCSWKCCQKKTTRCFPPQIWDTPDTNHKNHMYIYIHYLIDIQIIQYHVISSMCIKRSYHQSDVRVWEFICFTLGPLRHSNLPIGTEKHWKAQMMTTMAVSSKRKSASQKNLKKSKHLTPGVSK